MHRVTAVSQRQLHRSAALLTHLHPAASPRRIAVASATGVAVTATIAGSAFAGTLPSAVPSQPSDDFVSNLSAVDSATLVSLDIAWEPGDEVAATAAEPAVEEVVEEVATETASRDYDRSAASAESSSVVPPARAGSVVETALQYVGYPTFTVVAVRAALIAPVSCSTFLRSTVLVSLARLVSRVVQERRFLLQKHSRVTWSCGVKATLRSTLATAWSFMHQHLQPV